MEKILELREKPGYKDYIDNIRAHYNTNLTRREWKRKPISQILNKYKLTSNNVYGWIPKLKDKHVIELLKIHNNILKKTALENNATFIDIDLDLFYDIDFVDQGHFSESGSKKFAKLVFNKLNMCN